MLGDGKRAFSQLLAIVVLGPALACDGEATGPEPRGPEPAELAPRSTNLRPVVVVEKEGEQALPWTLEEVSFQGDEQGELFAIGAIAAWSAVHERYRLLARRGARGYVYGTLTSHRGSLRLVDESVGHGALSIPVLLGEGQKIAVPRRVLVGGAWVVRDKKWAWKSQSIRALLENKSQLSEMPLRHQPGLAPRWARAPKKPKSASQIPGGGGILGFRIVSAPSRKGDGWLISDLGGGDAVARLRLPGENSSYGDQSTRSEDETWKLERGKRYWVEIKRYRRRPVGELLTFRAISVPYFIGAKPSETKEK